MPMDSKCAIPTPLPELALRSEDVTPAIDGSAATKQHARFARARAKADAERSLHRPDAEGERLLHRRSPLEDRSDVTPVVVGSVQTIGLGVSGVPVVVPAERE
jgi:hypothetical protein